MSPSITNSSTVDSLKSPAIARRPSTSRRQPVNPTTGSLPSETNNLSDAANACARLVA